MAGGGDGGGVIELSSDSDNVIDLCSDSDGDPIASGGDETGGGDVVDLCSKSSDGEQGASALELPRDAPTPKPPTTTPREPTMSRRRRGRKQRQDWDAADVKFRESAAYVVYVLFSSKGHVYTGSSSKTPEDVVRAHNAGSRKSTKSRGPWTLAFHVGPFRNRRAAARFESLVKKKGSGSGAESKVAAATRALAASSPGLAEEDGVHLHRHSLQGPNKSNYTNSEQEQSHRRRQRPAAARGDGAEPPVRHT